MEKIINNKIIQYIDNISKKPNEYYMNNKNTIFNYHVYIN